MYKLLIVDDEEIEREGMANFIEWDKFNVEMVGTARNGEEGLRKIKELKPDIVMTDIKMPVMNGIEMICVAKKMQSRTEFIVLSGFGDYEFTSQAMQEGIRHYLLKPCDEEKIEEVIDKIKIDIEEKRKREKISNTAETLFPKAKEQIFRELLTNKSNIIREYKPVLNEEWGIKTKGHIVTFSVDTDIDYLEQFIVKNILEELLEKENVYLSTTIQKKMIFFVGKTVQEKLKKAIGKICTELKKIHTGPVIAAVSDIGGEDEIGVMYQQTCHLLKIGVAEKREGFICGETFQEVQENTENLLDYRKIQETEDFSELLFEIHLLFVKMTLKGYSFEQKEETAHWILKVLYGESVESSSEKTGLGNEKTIVKEMLDILISQRQLKIEAEEERIKNILIAIFQYLDKPELSIKFLATEILYMNEDYLSRLFLKRRKEKFSVYLQRQRILMAQRIFLYNPDIRISQVAELVGYSPDGQYFSKAFRKISGITPTEYKAQIRNI